MSPPSITTAVLKSARLISKPFYWLVERNQQRQQRELASDTAKGAHHTGSSAQQRRRALTIPASDLTASQTQSTLLTRLPIELRLTIWRECLGGRALYLTLYPANEVILSSSEVAGRPVLDYPSISLLFTCRQIYSEAITILYSSNFFCLLNHPCFLHLPTAILPQRLSSIRTLSLDFTITGLTNGPPQDWSHKAGDVLKHLTGLDHLQITVYIAFIWRRHLIYHHRELLEPLTALKCPEALRVTLPWNVDDPEDMKLEASSDIDYKGLVTMLERKGKRS